MLSGTCFTEFPEHYKSLQRDEIYDVLFFVNKIKKFASVGQLLWSKRKEMLGMLLDNNQLQAGISNRNLRQAATYYCIIDYFPVTVLTAQFYPLHKIVNSSSQNCMGRLKSNKCMVHETEKKPGFIRWRPSKIQERVLWETQAIQNSFKGRVHNFWHKADINMAITDY